jgi:hypothetical protein
VDADAAWTETYRSLREIFPSVPEASAELILEYVESGPDAEKGKQLRKAILKPRAVGPEMLEFLSAILGARMLIGHLLNLESATSAGDEDPGSGDTFDGLLAAFRSTPPTALQLQRAHAETEMALLARLNGLVSQCSDAGELAELVRIYNDIPPVDMDEFETGEPPRWNLSDGDEPD